MASHYHRSQHQHHPGTDHSFSLFYRGSASNDWRDSKSKLKTWTKSAQSKLTLCTSVTIQTNAFEKYLTWLPSKNMSSGCPSVLSQTKKLLLWDLSLRHPQVDLWPGALGGRHHTLYQGVRFGGNEKRKHSTPIISICKQNLRKVI